MVEKATSESQDERTVDRLQGSAFREGAQVIDTTGLPDGYVPPSGSLTPPPEPPPPPPSSGGNGQSGNSN